MNREDLFIDLALRTRLLTPSQIEECQKLRSLLGENSFQLTLPEVVIRKELLNPDQLRLINVAIRYEETRAEDLELGMFVVLKGFLPRDKMDDCLAVQEAPYKDGRHFPRLQDILVQRNLLTPQQVHVILRAREQLDSRVVQAGERPLSSARVAIVQPALPPPPPPPPPSKPAADPKTLQAGVQLTGLKAVPRRSRLKDAAGTDLAVMILDLEGSLDGQTFRRLDEYLAAVMESGTSQILMNAEKLEYVSSAGIGVLVGAVKRARDAKGDIRFCSVQPAVRKVFDMIGLQAVLRVYDSERGAIMSFKYGS